MSNNFPLLHSIDRAASVRRFLANGHSENGHERDWETLVRVALDYPALLRAAWRVTFDSFRDSGDFVPVRVVEDARNALLRSFAEVSESMRSIQESVGAWQQKTGLMAPGFNQIAGAMEEVRRLQEDVFRHWESLVEPMDEPPGDPIPVDEAFAQIAGVDKETWLRHVEEYKQKRKTRGME